MNEIKGIESYAIKPITPIEKAGRIKREKPRESIRDSQKNSNKKEKKEEEDKEDLIKNKIDIKI